MPASEADLRRVLEAMAPAPAGDARERVLAVMTDSALATTRPHRSRWRWALVALAAALFAVSPPGQAVAERLGELVGIGGDSTVDHSEDSGSPARGRGIVIAAGSVPGGPDYEIVAFANEPPAGERKFVGGSRVATCLSLDFPATEIHGEFDTTCFGEGEVTTLHTSGSSDYGADGELGRRYRYTVSGETSLDVDAVEVSYLDPHGDRVPASVAYGVADAEVLAQIEGHYPGGEFVAFIPDDGAEGRPVTNGPSVLDSVHVKALDSEGNVIATDDWGAQISEGRNRSDAGLRNLGEMIERCKAAERAGDEDMPSFCAKLKPARRRPGPIGPRGDVDARIDLLWREVIATAKAGELKAEVDPDEAIRVMKLALDHRRESEVTAMVEKLRAAGDLPPLGTPLPQLPPNSP